MLNRFYQANMSHKQNFVIDYLRESVKILYDILTLNWDSFW